MDRTKEFNCLNKACKQIKAFRISMLFLFYLWLNPLHQNFWDAVLSLINAFLFKLAFSYFNCYTYGLLSMSIMVLNNLQISYFTFHTSGPFHILIFTFVSYISFFHWTRVHNQWIKVLLKIFRSLAVVSSPVVETDKQHKLWIKLLYWLMSYLL